MMIDIHTHILPGLDDGAATLEEALQMAAISAAEGVTAVVATPHVISGFYENTPQQIRQAVVHFNSCLKAEGIPLQVLAGAEYRLEPDLPRRLAEGRLMTINDAGCYLLVELPASLVPPYTEQLLYEVQLQGVTPILAHPERNPGFNCNPEKLTRLARRGVLSQVTAGSLRGHFGLTAKRAAFKMLATGVAQMVASDAHSFRRRTPALTAAARDIETRWGADFTHAVFSGLPSRIIAGKAVEPVLREPETGFLARLLRAFSR